MPKAAGFIVAVTGAAAIQTGCLWFLSHFLGVEYPLACALAFSAGYVALIVVIQGLASRGNSLALARELRRHSLVAIGALLLMEASLYVIVDLLGGSLKVGNAIALAAVAGWVALGWVFVVSSPAPDAE